VNRTKQHCPTGVTNRQTHAWWTNAFACHEKFNFNFNPNTNCNHYPNDASKKGKGFPYLLPSIGPGADPSVQAVSLQADHYMPKVVAAYPVLCAVYIRKTG